MDVIMPQLGETVAEGKISLWHHKVGDKVSTDKALFDVSSDKAEMEVPAPTDGTLLKILVSAGETVPVGEVIAIIGDSADSNSVSGDAEDVVSPGFVSPSKASDIEPAKHFSNSSGTQGEQSNNRLSPAVRKLISEHKLDVSVIKGSGSNGRIMKKDVLSYIESRQLPRESGNTNSNLLSTLEKETIPFNTIRRKTAEHMVRSKTTIPHVMQAVETDFFRVALVRDNIATKWIDREGFSLTYLPFVARAICIAISDFPKINAVVEGEKLVVYRRINLAIAVDLDFEGLVAPVIKDADLKSVRELALAINELTHRARANRLQPDDFTEGTYTVSNSGSFGTMITAPIINQPQVAILSMDGITKKPTVIQGEEGESIAIRPVGILAQSFDHRAMDGAYSAAFLRRVREVIEKTNWSEIIG